MTDWWRNSCLILVGIVTALVGQYVALSERIVTHEDLRDIVEEQAGLINQIDRLVVRMTQSEITQARLIERIDLLLRRRDE
ncbi:hypothetical protein [uncultured Mediterranean phage]|nr:hypothetical protein [uncultured Mediterranean phage]